MFPFVLMRDDYGVKLINLKNGELYELLSDKRVDAYSYTQYACLEENSENGALDLLIIEWVDSHANVFRYELGADLLKALKYIAFS